MRGELYIGQFRLRNFTLTISKFELKIYLITRSMLVYSKHLRSYFWCDRSFCHLIKLSNFLRMKICLVSCELEPVKFCTSSSPLQLNSINRVYFRLGGLPWCTISLNCHITLNICNTTKESHVRLRKTFFLRSFRFKLDPNVLRDYAHRL